MKAGEQPGAQAGGAERWVVTDGTPSLGLKDQEHEFLFLSPCARSRACSQGHELGMSSVLHMHMNTRQRDTKQAFPSFSVRLYPLSLQLTAVCCY